MTGSSSACNALLVAVLVVCSAPSPAPCSLGGPSVHALAVGASEVAVRVDARIFIFDHDGSFRRELSPSELSLRGARLLALNDDGLLWISLSKEDDRGEVTSSTLAALDGSGEVVRRHRLAGAVTFYVTPDGRAYAGRVSGKRLRVERLDTASGRLSPHASIEIDKARRVLDLDTAPAVAWAVHGDGDVFVLTTAAEKGQVTRYQPSGERVQGWDVAPDPVTSVSYIKGLFLDRDGVPYVTHSSWEVSSSVANDGSVIRLDPAGGEPLRIQEGVGYLQHARVAPSGDVFVSDLSEEVVRYSATGERVLSWVAVPPRGDESWEGRRQRIADARSVGPSSPVPELVSAVVYGDYAMARSASRWLLARGESALPEVTRALVQLDGSYQLTSTAQQLWQAHPEAVVRLFEGSREESLRRLLAPHLAYVEAPPAGVRDVLSRMALEGHERARHALNHIGPPPEVVQARIREFRQALRAGESSFDAEWDLTQAYPYSIGALSAILLDPADPDRRAVRSLILEGSRELAKDSFEEKEPIPAGVISRTRSWAAHTDAVVRQTAAIALTSFGIGRHEADAIVAARSDPALVLPTLRAFAALAAGHAEAIGAHLDALSRLARSPRAATSSEDGLAELARIRHPVVVERCLALLTDDSLSAERRGSLLLGLEASAVPQPALLAALRERAWQRSLAREYFYYSFLDDVTRAHPDDAEIRGELKTTLLGLLSDPERDLEKHDPETDIDARAMAFGTLRALIEPADLPRLAPMVDDARLSPSSRWQLLSALSRIAPDDALRERIAPLLGDPDLALVTAQSLGRVGHPAALDTLVEQGLKRLGHYSSVELDIESFRPYGADAEQALLSLLDYPNAGTREVVRRLLVEWPSAEGRQRLWAELNEAVDSGRAPAPYTLAALALAGEDLAQPLLRLAAEHPDAIESLSREDDDGPIAGQLRRALASESDPRRAASLHRLIQQICSCEGQ